MKGLGLAEVSSVLGNRGRLCVPGGGSGREVVGVSASVTGAMGQVVGYRTQSPELHQQRQAWSSATNWKVPLACWPRSL